MRQDIHGFGRERYPAGMGSPEETRDVRVGDRERESAQAALAEHLAAGRLDLDEYTQRVDWCLSARTQRELLALFEDLPQPLPHLPETTAGAIAPSGAQSASTGAAGEVQSAASDSLEVALGFTLILGFPVAVVIGFAYDAWWVLAVPALLSGLLMIADTIVSHRANNR